MSLVDRLAAYCNTTPGDPFVQECLDEATALVDAHIGDATVPEPIYQRSIIEVGSELFAHRQAPGGITNAALGDAPPIRLARDPMLGAYPLLRKYLPAALA